MPKLKANYIQCAEDIINLIPDFKTLIQDVEGKNWSAVVAELQTIS